MFLYLWVISMQPPTPAAFIPHGLVSGDTAIPVLQALLVWRECMKEMDKWKFNFSFWPSVRVIALPWAHLEREMKRRAGKACSGVCTRDTSMQSRLRRAAAPPAQTHLGVGFSGSQIRGKMTFELFPPACMGGQP